MKASQILSVPMLILSGGIFVGIGLNEQVWHLICIYWFLATFKCLMEVLQK